MKGTLFLGHRPGEPLLLEGQQRQQDSGRRLHLRVHLDSGPTSLSVSRVAWEPSQPTHLGRAELVRVLDLLLALQVRQVGRRLWRRLLATAFGLAGALRLLRRRLLLMRLFLLLISIIISIIIGVRTCKNI